MQVSKPAAFFSYHSFKT